VITIDQHHFTFSLSMTQQLLQQRLSYSEDKNTIAEKRLGNFSN